jgi:hypothetical protein
MRRHGLLSKADWKHLTSVDHPKIRESMEDYGVSPAQFEAMKKRIRKIFKV